MAIDKAIAQAPSFINVPSDEINDLDIENNRPEGGVEIAIANPDAVSIATEDGGVIIDFDPGGDLDESNNHDDNLADFMDEGTLQRLSSD